MNDEPLILPLEVKDALRPQDILPALRKSKSLPNQAWNFLSSSGASEARDTEAMSSSCSCV